MSRLTLENRGPNETVLKLPRGTEVLFSYETPVAAWVNDGVGYVRTEENFSMTTSKHINRFVNGVVGVRTVSQEKIEGLLEVDQS